MISARAYKQQLENRTDQGDKWYELRTCSYYDIFREPKIMFSEVQVSPKFAFDKKGYYANKTIFSIPRDDLALVGILNSKLVWFLVQNYCNRVQGGYILSWKFFGRILIPRSLPKELNSLVEKMSGLMEGFLILKDKKTDESRRIEEAMKRTDSEIDELVYRIYRLNKEEENCRE